MSTLDIKNLIGGAAVAAVGLAFVYPSFGYGIGTPSEMGAGFFPLILGTATVLVGIALFLSGLRGGMAGPLEAIAWRPLIAVLGGIGAFALLLDRLGLAAAVMAAAGVAALGDRETRLFEIVLLGALLTVLCWLIFTLGLGMPMPLFRGL